MSAYSFRYEIDGALSYELGFATHDELVAYLRARHPDIAPPGPDLHAVRKEFKEQEDRWYKCARLYWMREATLIKLLTPGEPPCPELAALKPGWFVAAMGWDEARRRFAVKVCSPEFDCVPEAGYLPSVEVA